jgi:sugar phosphate isomerase/epimerase
MTTKAFFTLVILLASSSFLSGISLADDSAQKTYPFFALCMDTHDAKCRTVEQQNEMLHKLGFDGVAHLWLGGLPERVASAKKHSLKVTQVYFRVDLSADPPFDQKLAEVLPCLKGEGSQLALLIYGGKPSDASLDEKAMNILRQIRAVAEQSDVQVVLYPHGDAWLEKISDCVRVAEKFNKKYSDQKIYAMFNLCHWAATDKSRSLESALTSIKPYLAAVTINGTDTPEEIQTKKGNWIQPLDSGSFKVAVLLDLLKKIGYNGPVGLQCYGITGDAEEHLKRSMKAWQSWNNP